jgi:hypothetical protein
MTVLLRSLIVWLMLLALPYQGYASATMLLCIAPATAAGSSAHAGMPSGPHDHAAMMAAQADEDHASHASHQHGDDGQSAHNGTKCGGTACCAAAAPVLTPALEVPAPLLVSVAVPFYSDFLPAVDLAHPERPPQGLHA